MICAWKALLTVLPDWLAQETDRYGEGPILELRLRRGKCAEFVTPRGSQWGCRQINTEDLRHCINTASRYSPWAARTIGKGYLTIQGGHRMGITGQAVMEDASMKGIRDVEMICIRVARDFPGIGEKLSRLKGSILLVGPPGSGKTTLLRDLIRWISQNETVAAVDEREELFPNVHDLPCFDEGLRLDVLSGCPKAVGMEQMLRTMGPACIAVDEITAPEDVRAILQVQGCGVRLLATAHGESVEDLRKRPVYRNLLRHNVFEHIIVLGRDKSWREERMVL